MDICVPLPATIGANGGSPKRRLRVAILTGSLGNAGAERQMFYIVRGLAEVGVDVRLYSLEERGCYGEALKAIGIEPNWFGKYSYPPIRLTYLVHLLRRFRPHLIQSVHAYTNLYSALAAKLLGSISVGGLRGDLAAFLSERPAVNSRLLTMPDGLVVNSHKALKDIRDRAAAHPARTYFLPNGVDLPSFRPLAGDASEGSECVCVQVGRLVPSKRVDVFLNALTVARSVAPGVSGLVIGEGTDGIRMTKLAYQLGLSPNHVAFLGNRHDVPDILRRASILVLCSDAEGCPNVVLEGMAAGLPIVTTPAGDAPRIVEQGRAGYVVPFNSPEVVANAIVTLARAPALRRRFGLAGRRYIERYHSAPALAGRLLEIYSELLRARHLSENQGKEECGSRVAEEHSLPWA